MFRRAVHPPLAAAARYDFMRPICELNSPGLKWMSLGSIIDQPKISVPCKEGLSVPCQQFGQSRRSESQNQFVTFASYPVFRQQQDPTSFVQTRQRSSEAVRENKDVFIYEGPLSTAVSRLKKLSLFSCFCTFTGAPLMMYLQEAGGATFGAKAAIAGMICSFGFFTTGLLHWFTVPYVHRLRYDRATRMVEVDTLNLFAQHKSTTFHVSEAKPPNSVRPLSTFQVDGKIYYLDANNFSDAALLKELSSEDQVESVMDEKYEK